MKFFYITRLLLACFLCMQAVLLSAQGVDGVTGASQSVKVKTAKCETVICRGLNVHTSGRMVKVGKSAPDFDAVGTDQNEVRLSSYHGKRVILNVFPSLDTPTCALSVRRFNERAAALHNTVVLCVSMDLPFAQSRFCATEGLKNVVPLSLFRSRLFARNYGLRLTDGPLEGLMARAVIVIDAKGVVRYTELVGDISHEPDYDAALKAVAE